MNTANINYSTILDINASVNLNIYTVLNVPVLENRRMREDMTTVYKYLRGLNKF